MDRSEAAQGPRPYHPTRRLNVAPHMRSGANYVRPPAPILGYEAGNAGARLVHTVALWHNAMEGLL